ncbi:MAG TPA: helix-turn-helix domain-containing protein, partial [Haliangium sp.]|nr:helix-turn-helix domain-containing protein [Haliangium sp.]
MRSIGRAARQARRVRKLTQEDVAERVGVSTQFYGRIERGNALPSVTTLRRMLEVLDLRADELLGALDLDDAGPDESNHAQDADQDADLQLAQVPESPRLRRVMRYLRRASAATLRVVELLLDQMDEAGALRRAQGNADPGSPEDEPEPDDDVKALSASTATAESADTEAVAS